MEDLINESYEFEQVDNDPLHTKYVIKDILDRSGKKTVVSYQGKDNRKSFDETFGKNKMEIASKIIGDNSISLSKKLALK
jgi:hypothetical protein